MLAMRRNCSNKFLGKKFHSVYLDVTIWFELYFRSSVVSSWSSGFIWFAQTVRNSVLASRVSRICLTKTKITVDTFQKTGSESLQSLDLGGLTRNCKVFRMQVFSSRKLRNFFQQPRQVFLNLSFMLMQRRCSAQQKEMIGKEASRWALHGRIPRTENSTECCFCY